MDPHGIAAELAALAAQLERRETAAAQDMPPERPLPPERPSLPERSLPPERLLPPEWNSTLEELGRELARRGGEAEDVVAAHPWAALASAFLLGVMVGRLGSRE